MRLAGDFHSVTAAVGLSIDVLILFLPSDARDAMNEADGDTPPDPDPRRPCPSPAGASGAFRSSLGAGDVIDAVAKCCAGRWVALDDDGLPSPSWA
jgi:hypothetical protein